MKVCIIDLSYQLHRSLRVDELAKLTDSNGRATGGIFGVTRILTGIMENYQNYLPVFVSDKGLSQRRLDVYPNYKRAMDKVNEKKVPDEELSASELEDRKSHEEYIAKYKKSKEYIKDICSQIGIPYIEIDGVEGDDAAAVILQSPSVTSVVLVSDDNDWRAMLDLRDDINSELFRVMKREVITRDQFLDSSKSIDRFTLVKSIVGDGSDNIPKLAYGVGESYATKFIDCLLDKGYSYDEIRNWDNGDKLIQELRSDYRGKKLESFIGAMETTKTLKQNTDLIDLRLIDDVTRDECMKLFHSELDKCFKSDSSIFKVVSAFGSYQITNFDALRLSSHLTKFIKSNKI